MMDRDQCKPIVAYVGYESMRVHRNNGGHSSSSSWEIRNKKNDWLCSSFKEVIKEHFCLPTVTLNLSSPNYLFVWTGHFHTKKKSLHKICMSVTHRNKLSCPRSLSTCTYSRISLGPETDRKIWLGSETGKGERDLNMLLTALKAFCRGYTCCLPCSARLYQHF